MRNLIFKLEKNRHNYVSKTSNRSHHVDSKLFPYIGIFMYFAAEIIIPNILYEPYAKSKLWFVIRHNFDDILDSFGIINDFIFSYKTESKNTVAIIIRDFINMHINTITNKKERKEIENSGRIGWIENIVLGDLCKFITVKKIPIDNLDGTQTIKAELRFIKDAPELRVPIAERGPYNYNKEFVENPPPMDDDV